MLDITENMLVAFTKFKPVAQLIEGTDNKNAASLAAFFLVLIYMLCRCP